MFRGIVIHGGSNRTHLLRYLVAAAECIEVQRDFDGTPNEHELKRIAGTMAPEVAIVDLHSVDLLPVVGCLREVTPDIALIGFGASLEAALMAPRVGCDLVLPEDADAGDLRSVVQETLRKRQGGQEKGLFCFLPAKAGSGASTIVMNTAAALAREQGKRVLVVDADLRSGVQAVLLGTEPTRSIQSLLAGVEQMDRRRLDELVYQAEGVDYLLSSRSPDAEPPEWSHYFHLLSLIRGRYDAVLVDLPELVNPATYELVRRAERVYVVTTAEVPSLSLARNRCEELARLKLPREVSGVLVNRWQREDPSVEQIAGMVGEQVTRIFPNDYPAVRAAVLEGRPVAARTRLGAAYAEFAGELFGIEAAPEKGLTGKLKSMWGLRESIRA